MPSSTNKLSSEDAELRDEVSHQDSGNFLQTAYRHACAADLETPQMRVSHNDSYSVPNDIGRNLQPDGREDYYPAQINAAQHVSTSAGNSLPPFESMASSRGSEGLTDRGEIRSIPRQASDDSSACGRVSESKSSHVCIATVN